MIFSFTLKPKKTHFACVQVQLNVKTQKCSPLEQSISGVLLSGVGGVGVSTVCITHRATASTFNGKSARQQ